MGFPSASYFTPVPPPWENPNLTAEERQRWEVFLRRKRIEQRRYSTRRVRDDDGPGWGLIGFIIGSLF